MSVLRTQLSGIVRRPARLLLSGLAVLVASFVVFATVLAQQVAERTMLDNVSGTPAAADLVVGGDQPIGTGVPATIRAVPGVAEVAGRSDYGVSFGASYLNLAADPGSGPLALTRVVQGRYPAAAGEIAVTRRTADRMGLPIGAVAAVHAGAPGGRPVRLSVTGIVDARDDFGRTGYAPLDSLVPSFPDLTLRQVEVRLVPGTAADAVRSRLQAVVAALPARGGEPRPVVRTGAAVRADEAEAVVEDLDVLFALVGMFVAVAVVAAALVATSTFRIVFAQRVRQLALLRAVGAGRSAITRALAAEGALTGLVAGTVGTLGALAAGHLAAPVLRGFGVPVAGPGVPVAAGLAVVALAVAITLVAVLAPAVSAARVAPLAALRAAGTSGGRAGIGRVRWVAGLLLLAAGASMAAVVTARLPGPDAKDYDPPWMLLGIVASGAAVFFALVALGPGLVRPVLYAVGRPLWHSGAVGRLAVGGVGGAPRRAAAVSVVVALGVTLIAGLVVGGASMRVLVERSLALSVPADFELAAGDGTTIPTTVADRARSRTELAHVLPYRRVNGLSLGAARVPLRGSDLNLGALPAVGALDVRTGSLTGLGPGRVVLSGFAADVTGLAAGDVTTMRAGGRSGPVTVAATFPADLPLHTDVVADPADLTRLGAAAGYSGLLADAAAPGEQARTAGQEALRQLAGGRDGVGVDVLADDRDQLNRVVDGVLGVAMGLIGLTVLIAVVGVGTTTALSVVERIRESGLLRAVGLSRGGLRTMLTAEAALYGVIGATIGLLLGVPYAWLAVAALGVDAPLRLPAGQLAAVFAILVALTALAGVLPARRASRVSPVAALGTDG